MRAWRRARPLFATALAGVVVLAGCAGGEPEGTGSPTLARPTGSEAPTGSVRPTVPADLTPSDWVTGLEVPWGLVVLPAGALLSERDSGRVLHVAADGSVTRLAVVAASGGGEGGLLGIALSPAGGHLYAYYTAGSESRVVRFPLGGCDLLASGGADGAGCVLGAEELVLGGIPAGTIHNGGQLAFGPDWKLYVSTGDAGRAELAQDPDSLAGKILRVTPEGLPAAGNPFGNAVYSRGHRNVQGLAFDDNGNLWASEFGQGTWDELNLIEGGGNYGWPEVEGPGGAAGARFVDPVRAWRTEEASPSGLTFWRGSLWMAALRGGALWQIPLLHPGVAGTPVAHWAGEFGRLRAVGSAGSEFPLVVGTSNRDGRGSVRAGDDRLLRIE